MPSLDDLRRLLFADFSLESERRKPLTVLGEVAYGQKQGRIITARKRTFDEPLKIVTEEELAVTCPPSGAPTHITATWSMTGTVATCTDHAADVDVSASGNIDEEDFPWGGSPCQITPTLTDSQPVTFTCPEDCGFPYVARNAVVEIFLVYDEGSYSLRITGIIDGVICGGNGDTTPIQDFAQDLGADPTGTYHIEVASSGAELDWVFDIEIT